MITLAQLIAKYRDGLRADTASAAYCRQTWGKALLVRVGVDPKAEIESVHVPAAWLSSARKTGGQTATTRDLVVALDVHCGAGPEARSGGPSVPLEVAAENERLEALVDLCVAACETALDGTNADINGYEATFDFVSNAPLCSARVLLTTTVPTLIGGTIELES